MNYRCFCAFTRTNLQKNIRNTNCYFSTTQKSYRKKHWAKERRQVTNVDRALIHFDDFYGKVFTNRWPSIRLALLSARKYCAVVNNLSDADEISMKLSRIGAINVGKRFQKELKKIANVETDTPTSDHIVVNDDDAIDDRTETNVGESGDEENELVEENPLMSSDPSELDYFVPSSERIGEDSELINEDEYYEFYKPQTDFKINFTENDLITFPEKLKMFTFDRGDFTLFPSPRQDKLSIYEYYVMDAASLFPVITLNLQHGDSFLDLCSAPGGKAMAVLQTFLADTITCNEKDSGRFNKLQRVVASHVPKFDALKDRLLMTQLDGRQHEFFPKFDKILVDVPCTNDRHSVHQNDNSIFKVKRITERIRLPEYQKDLLKSALQMLKPGGSVVYCTCSLSPIQNDGVVHMALQQLWEETDASFTVDDLTTLNKVFSFMFKYSECKFGTLIVPFLPLNYGPMYVSKITRI